MFCFDNSDLGDDNFPFLWTDDEELLFNFNLSSLSHLDLDVDRRWEFDLFRLCSNSFLPLDLDLDLRLCLITDLDLDLDLVLLLLLDLE